MVHCQSYLDYEHLTANESFYFDISFLYHNIKIEKNLQTGIYNARTKFQISSVPKLKLSAPNDLKNAKK